MVLPWFDTHLIRCRCVNCGEVTMQPTLDEQDRGRLVKSWFCGKCPPPKGTALDKVCENGNVK